MEKRAGRLDTGCRKWTRILRGNSARRFCDRSRLWLPALCLKIFSAGNEKSCTNHRGDFLFHNKRLEVTREIYRRYRKLNLCFKKTGKSTFDHLQEHFEHSFFAIASLFPITAVKHPHLLWPFHARIPKLTVYGLHANTPTSPVCKCTSDLSFIAQFKRPR